MSESTEGITEEEAENNVLKKLYVDEKKIDRNLLYNGLSKYIRIDRDTAEMRPLGNYDDLSNREKIIIRLLYHQALVGLGRRSSSQSGESTKSLAKIIDASSSEVKKELKDIDFVEERKTGKTGMTTRYFIPGYRIEEAVEDLS